MEKIYLWPFFRRFLHKWFDLRKCIFSYIDTDFLRYETIKPISISFIFELKRDSAWKRWMMRFLMMPSAIESGHVIPRLCTILLEWYASYHADDAPMRSRADNFRQRHFKTPTSSAAKHYGWHCDGLDCEMNTRGRFIACQLPCQPCRLISI